MLRRGGGPPPLQRRYAEFDHLEVLSLCSTEATAEFSGQTVTACTRNFDYVLPPAFQLRQSMQVTYVVCRDTNMP